MSVSARREETPPKGSAGLNGGLAVPWAWQAQCPGTSSFSEEGDFKTWPWWGMLFFWNRGLIPGRAPPAFPSLGTFSFSTPIAGIFSASFGVEWWR